VPALRRQPNKLTTPVTLGLLPGHQSAGSERGKEAAEISGVEIEFTPQIGYRDIVSVCQLERHPGLG
jgi:hypothetical protein